MVGHVAAQTLLMVIVVSLVLSTIGFFISAPMLGVMGVEPVIHAEATHYLRVSFLGIVFFFFFAMYQAIMRGMGDVKIPLYLITIALVLNIAITPVFIFGWGPIPAAGVTGAAWSTMVTQALVAGIGLFLLLGERYGIALRLRDFVPDWPLIKRTAMLGFPASVEQAARALGLPP